MRGRHLLTVAAPTKQESHNRAPAYKVRDGVAYCWMPALTQAECAFVQRVEARLAAMRYNEGAGRAVVCWDTETTNRPSVSFWESCGIVQIGAVAGEGAERREFLCEANPYPLHLTPAAAEANKLSTDEVAIAKFLDFVADESERCGGALPLLVAHNAQFDNKVLVMAAWKAGVDVPASWRSLDSLTLADHIAMRCRAKEEDPTTALNIFAVAKANYYGDSLATLSPQTRTGRTLGDLGRYLKLPFQPHQLHNALEDSRLLADIVSGLRREFGEDGDVLAFNALQEQQPETFKKRPLVQLGELKHAYVVESRTPKDDKKEKNDDKTTPSASAGAQRLRRVAPSSLSAAPTRRSGAGSRKLTPPFPNEEASAAVIAETEDLESDEAADEDEEDEEEEEEDDDEDEDDEEEEDDDEDDDEDEEEDDEIAAVADKVEVGRQRRAAAQERTRGDDARVRWVAASAGGVVDRDEIVTDAVLQQWHPFTAPLDKLGVPRKSLNATLLAKLQDAGFVTLLDLLRHIPRLEDASHPSIRMDSSERVQLNGGVLRVRKVAKGFRCSSVQFDFLAAVLAEDGTVVQKQVTAVAFSGGGFKGGYVVDKYAMLLRTALSSGDDLALVGRFKPSKTSGDPQFNVTEMNVVTPLEACMREAADATSSQRPVYPSRKGMKETDFRRIIPLVLQHIRTAAPAPGADAPPAACSDAAMDPLPPSVLDRYNLMPWLDALDIMHAPLGTEVSTEQRVAARRRLVFQELLLLQLMLLNKRIAQQAAAGGGVVCDRTELLDAATAALPFELTAAQSRCLREILDDMAAPFPMLRLLQGDVGSGKTAVAFLAALAAIDSGYQVAMLVPNEVLAQQHVRAVGSFLDRMAPAARRPAVEVLLGATKAKERRVIRERLADGSIDFLIGTTALNNDDEVFKRLGLVIIDEQHRFGVRQRALLSKKSGAGGAAAAPHTLHMTATPIPRTISMTLWGHMSTSALDELPPGRLPVKTKIVKLPPGAHVASSDSKRQQVLAEIAAELERGGSVFWVFPLVEESEHFEGMGSAHDTFQHATERSDILRDQAVVLTGRMSSEEKALALGAFRAGAKRLLISTVVIEVGVDVPDATLMVVEHAERLGVLQLHQLRGRVGRSSKQSACSLLTTGNVGYERLKVLQESNNGFVVAKADMLSRGAGQLLGQRQSGPAELGLGSMLSVTDLCLDEPTLLEARECAAELIVDGLAGLPPPIIAALEGYHMTSLLKFAMQDVDMHIE